MIFVFKRVVSNDIEKFLIWFKMELEINTRFKDIYLQVCVDGFTWLIRQWSIATEKKSSMATEEVVNKIEMKFEQNMLVLEDVDSKEIMQNLFEIKVFRIYKKVLKALNMCKE